MGTPARKLAVAACVWTLAGCLPAGEPPVGRHLLKERQLSGVFLSPAEQDGVPSYVLATGPVQHLALDPSGPERKLADVYRFSDPPLAATLDGLAGVAPLSEGMLFPDEDPPSYTFATDSAGRLLFVKLAPDAPPAEVPHFELWRFALGSGSRELLASAPPGSASLVNSDPRLGVRSYLLSPGRTQVFAGYFGAGWIIGPTRIQSLWSALDVAFLGEDLYCSGAVTAAPNAWSAGSDIIRVKPDADPEILLSSTGQLALAPVLGDFAPQLLLFLSTEGGFAPFALLDSETLESRPLPLARGQASFVSASPDGHLLLFSTTIAASEPTQPAERRLFLYDWMADGFEVIDSARVGKNIGDVSEWRPATSELWFSTLPDGFAIWKLGAGVTTLPGNLFAFPAYPGHAARFSPDGRYWFSWTPNEGSRPTVFVGRADEPAAPLLGLNPAGTATGRCWQLEDGRLLVEVWASDHRRNDIYLVDPGAGTSRAIGSAGQVVAVGRSRVLALLNWQLSRASGQLTLVDYESGARTLLAEDVYAVDVDRGKSANVPAGTDGLAPGTRVAFLCRNRLESRDDGLWVAELP